MARILVAFDTVEGQTQKIAEHIAQRSTDKGHPAKVINVSSLAKDLADDRYDGAIIGASIHIGKHSRQFIEFLENRRLWLDGIPVAFYSVSLSASGDEGEKRVAQGYVDDLLEKTGWLPYSTTTIGGSLRISALQLLETAAHAADLKETGACD